MDSIVKIVSIFEETIREKNKIIEQLKYKINELEHHAKMDFLTNTFNRKYGVELFEEKLCESKTKGVYFSVCFMDVDNFKYINDQYGHCKGDMVLKSIGMAVARSIREVDIAVRMGGDEFLIAFPGIAVEEAIKIWKGFEADLEKQNFIFQENFIPRLSYGFSEYSPEGVDGGVSANELIKEADLNMYKMKESKMYSSKERKL